MSKRPNGLACPHCDSAAHIRSSRKITRTYRQMTCQCQNIDCGHTFGADMTVTHTISPSARPNPNIFLTSVPPRRRIANDVAPVAANQSNPRGPEVPPLNDNTTLGEALG